MDPKKLVKRRFTIYEDKVDGAVFTDLK